MMPRALRERNMNVEESTPLKDEGEDEIEDKVEDEVEDEVEVLHETDEDDEEVMAEEIVNEEEREELIAQLRTDLQSKFSHGVLGQTASSSTAGRIPRRESGRTKREMSTLVVILLALMNAAVLALAVVVLTDSEDKVAEAVRPFLSPQRWKLSLPTLTTSENRNLFLRGEFRLLVKSFKAKRRAALEQRVRKMVGDAYSQITRLDSEEFEVDDIVRDVAELLAADRMLKPDYALISAGAKVLATEPSALTQWKDFISERAAYLIGRKLDTISALPNPASIAFTVRIQALPQTPPTFPSFLVECRSRFQSRRHWKIHFRSKTSLHARTFGNS